MTGLMGHRHLLMGIVVPPSGIVLSGNQSIAAVGAFGKTISLPVTGVSVTTAAGTVSIAAGSVTKEMLFGFETATTTTAEEEISATTVTGLLAGNVYRDSTYAEYGTYSIALETTEFNVSSAAPATTSKNWTVEFSVRRVDYGGGVYGGGPAIYINSGSADGFQIGLDVLYDTSPPFDPYPIVNVQNGAGSLSTALESDNTGTSAWVKFAVVLDKDSGALNLYQAGTLVDTITAASFSSTPWALTDVKFGYSGALYNIGTPFYLDNILISAGVKYTGSSYTLPTGPFTP